MRQKTRLLFVLLAIAASSCLIVWTVGGFQALFLDASTEDADFIGHYDLCVRPEVQEPSVARGGTFNSPLARPKNDSKENNKEEKSVAINASIEKNTNDEFGDKTKRREGRKGKGQRRKDSNAPVFPQSLVDELRADEAVAICDEISSIRMFVYSSGMIASILEDPDLDDEKDKPTLKRSIELSDEELEEFGGAPKGIDPELARKALGSLRATMGSPMGLGSTFQGTTAEEAPFELKDGRWFEQKDANGEVPYEAVMTSKGNERFKTQVGESILIIDKPSLTDVTTIYQLKVVGIVEDLENDGFYVSRKLAQKIAKNDAIQTNALFIKLRADVEAFREKWAERLEKEASGVKIMTAKDIADARAAAFKNDKAFKYQAASGTLLAALAALLIVFTALNMSVDEEKRLIAFYRASGLTRAQVGKSILFEAIVLALPGWFAGMAVGWILVWICAGKSTGLNFQTTGLSFLCVFVGAILASLYPIFQSARVKPLDAIGDVEKKFPNAKRWRKQTWIFIILAIVGSAAILTDLFIVYNLPGDNAKRAALHSGFGVMLIATGVVCWLPLAIRLAELILLPILAWVFRLDSRALRRDLSGNAWRIAAVSVALSVGGGLFVTMQIWGYSMLDPFLPGKRSPDAFAAFLPNGLRPEIVEQLTRLPMVDSERFIPVAVEQAAFAQDSIPEDSKKSAYANVVFFGVDVNKAFLGERPLIDMRFRQGDPEKAFAAMLSGRGVVVTDSLVVDYNLNLGDALKVVHPRDESKTLEYPIVGVVSFPGWQWLSKTGGVRRNFGRSGGIVFAREGIIATDFQIERRAYFWFDAKNGEEIDYNSTEFACDVLARKNLSLDQNDPSVMKTFDSPATQIAYVKLSTRKSLTESISRRADSVIWGLSKTPLTTLIIAAIAVVGAIANSVRARRWVYGVMRAVGLTRWALIRGILVEAILIGFVASFASFAFGFFAAHGALKLGQSVFGSLDPPLLLPIKGLTIGLGLTVALCFTAALYPAIKTGRTETLKLLQSGRRVE